jgi:metallo-beta-lactamase family protein
MVLFCGLSAVGTTGRANPRRGKKLKLFGEEISVNAEITYFPGKSATPTRRACSQWINAFRTKPAMVFVNHGEDESVRSYANCLTDEYGLHDERAQLRRGVRSRGGSVYRDADRHPIERKTAKQQRAASAFDALVAAGERLNRADPHLQGASRTRSSGSSRARSTP